MILRPTFAVVLTLQLGAGEWMAPEEPAADSASEEVMPEDADPTSEAADLYRQGEAKFAAADYEGAIELWTEAYAHVAGTDDPRAGAILDALVYNMAKAQMFAFDLDADEMRLKRARASLERHLEHLESRTDIDADELATSLADGRSLLADIEAKLADVPGKEPEPRPQPQPQPRPDPTDETEAAPTSPGRGLIVGGSVLTVLGAAGVGVMGAGLAIGSGAAADVEGWEDESTREGLPATAIQRGKVGNILTGVGIGAGAVFLASGIALIVIGKKKNRSSRQALLPGFAPSGAGLTYVGRF